MLESFLAAAESSRADSFDFICSVLRYLFHLNTVEVFMYEYGAFKEMKTSKSFWVHNYILRFYSGKVSLQQLFYFFFATLTM